MRIYQFVYSTATIVIVLIYHTTVHTTMLKIAATLFVLSIAPVFNEARPQESPMPYDFNWKVEDEPSGNYYSQNEVGTETGRVDGSYTVLLPDGRLMTVTYYVDGESGFVPSVSFINNAKPFAGKR